MGENVQAATLYFSPSAGNFTVGNIFTVNVLVNTESAAINNVEATINFPSDLLEIVSVSRSGSIFSLWVEEPTFSNSVGALSFNGGLPTPGYNGSAGKVLSAVFRAKNEGSASLLFSSAAVRANDGYGTNVFKTGVQALFNLVSEKKPLPPKKEEIPPTSIVGKVPEASSVFSPTHPDFNKWYNNKNPQFSWVLPADVNGVSIYFSQSSVSNPGPVSNGIFANKSYENVADGVWYFHIKTRNSAGWGPITHFKIQIDTQPPEPFEIKFIDGDETENPKPTVIFDTKDSLSGIDYYKIKIGEGDFFSIAPEVVKSNPYVLPPQTPGKRSILVQAFDKAGNYQTVVEEFEILAIKSPVITEYPEELQSGEPLIVRGSTYPNSKVIIWLQREKDDPKSFTVQSDPAGKFTFVADERLGDGIYKLWAEVIDERGAKSDSSEKVTVIVQKPVAVQIGLKAIDVLAVLIPLIALIIFLLALLWYGWHKFSSLRKRLQKEVREAESALHRAFDLLKEDIGEQIKMLEKTRTKRQLTEEEEKAIKQLKKDLDDAEKFVKKEIEDIEKEIKE